MVKCLNCHKEVKQHDGKRHKLYCNDACKKAYQRKAKLVDNGTESISGHNGTVISGQVLHGRLRPFKDVFNPTPWSSLTKAEQDERRKDMIAAGAALTGGYQMAPSERANYKPADQLGKGEHNHVSKPGDPDYNGVCTPEWIEEKRRVDRAEDAAGLVHRHEARP